MLFSGVSVAVCTQTQQAPVSQCQQGNTCPQPNCQCQPLSQPGQYGCCQQPAQQPMPQPAPQAISVSVGTIQSSFGLFLACTRKPVDCFLFQRCARKHNNRPCRNANKATLVLSQTALANHFHSQTRTVAVSSRLQLLHHRRHRNQCKLVSA